MHHTMCAIFIADGYVFTQLYGFVLLIRYNGSHLSQTMYSWMDGTMIIAKFTSREVGRILAVLIRVLA